MIEHGRYCGLYFEEEIMYLNQELPAIDVLREIATANAEEAGVEILPGPPSVWHTHVSEEKLGTDFGTPVQVWEYPGVRNI